MIVGFFPDDKLKLNNKYTRQLLDTKFISHKVTFILIREATHKEYIECIRERREPTPAEYHNVNGYKFYEILTD